LNSIKKSVTPVTDVFRLIDHRSIPKSAVEKYKIDVVLNDAKVEARYPYFVDGVHTGNKVRTKDKKFFVEGDVNMMRNYMGKVSSLLVRLRLLLWSKGSMTPLAVGCCLVADILLLALLMLLLRSLTVFGTSSTLDSFESVVVCLDADTAKVRADGTVFYPGQEAAKKIAELFRPGKVRVLTLKEGKDPNDYLKNGRSQRVCKGVVGCPAVHAGRSQDWD
jgi:hypothetical protein